MIVLRRILNESIVIGEPPNQIVVSVGAIHGTRVTLGITAPIRMHINRAECRPSTEHMQPGKEQE